MKNDHAAHRLIEIGREEARLMRELARLQKERCKLLCEGLDRHGADLGITGDVQTLATEPKD